MKLNDTIRYSDFKISENHPALNLRLFENTAPEKHTGNVRAVLWMLSQLVQLVGDDLLSGWKHMRIGVESD